MSISTFQFERIMRSYDYTRQKNHALHMKRQEEIYEKIPEIQQIDKQIASQSIQLGKQLLFQSDSSSLLDDLKIKNMELSMKKIELLVSNGYEPDYLNPIYQCPDCKDTGYIKEKKCHCLKQAIVHEVYHQSNILQKLEEENFETFSYEYYSDEPVFQNLPSPRENIFSVVKQCKNFIRTFKENPGQNILFLGNVGVGKSFLSNCIAKELMEEAYTVIYLTSFQLVETFEDHRFHRFEDPDASYSLDYVLNCDLLIIDDLGTELTNNFVVSQLFLCINERLLKKKSTIISTNLSLKELNETYYERIVSRITENYLICHIYGDDIRQKKSFIGESFV